MQDYHAPDIRNFALIGHAATGKTILCDAMLACAGQLGRIGRIDNGSTVSDFHPDEKEHQNSIHASLLRTEWLGRKFNIIDTPGFPDFVSEPLSALRVADFALVVMNGTHGVEVGTDQLWEAAEQAAIPRFLVTNMLDKEHTRFDEILEEAREHFGSRVFPMTLPVDAGPGFRRILDVMRSEVITFADDASGKFTEAPAEGDLKDKVRELHRQLIEYVAESDDDLLAKFFENDTLSEEEMRAHVHEAVQKQIFTPLFSCSGLTNVGVARLMDFIAKYGSSPVDRATSTGRLADGGEVVVALDDAETVAMVFKTMNESHVGSLSYFRVYSGDVSVGIELINAQNGTAERIGQIFSVNGSQREAVKTLHAGDIGAVVKLKNTHTGDDLCSPSRVVLLPGVDFPPPNTHGALEIKAKSDLNKLAEGLALLHEEDPTFQYRFDQEVGQTIISGQGEIQLKIVAEELKRRYNIEVETTEPRVPYRETIRGRGESKYRHKKQTGGAGQFAEVWMRIEPLARNSGVEFTNSLVGSNVDRVFVPSVEKGVMAACSEGVLAGCPVVDVKIDFYDGKQHTVDSKDIAFQIAGKSAFHECMQAARPCLLEPIMDLRVIVPGDVVGDVMADISARRGRVMGVETEGRLEVVVAQVPQSELYRYASNLRAITAGRGKHREAFSHYEELPGEYETKVIAQVKASREREH
jgi:elongation factor G